MNKQELNNYAKEKAELLRLETKAYIILLMAFENKHYASQIWTDPNTKIRFYGEVEIDHCGDPHLNVLQEISDQCLKTPDSDSKQDEMREAFADEIEARHRNYQIQNEERIEYLTSRI